MDAKTKNHEEIDFDDLKNFIINFKHQGGKSILFTGGEALLYSRIEEALTFSKKIGLQNLLFTNGLLLNKKNIYIYKNVVDKFVVSIDGPSEIHDSRRGYKGAYEHLIKVLQLFYEWKILFEVQMTVGKQHLSYMEDVLKIAKDFDAEKIKFASIVKVGRGRNSVDVLDDGGVEQFIQEFTKIEKKYRDEIVVTSNIQSLDEVKMRYSNVVPQVVWVLTNGSVQLLTSTPCEKLRIGTIEEEIDKKKVRNALKNANDIIRMSMIKKSKIINLFEEIENNL